MTRSRPGKWSPSFPVELGLVGREQAVISRAAGYQFSVRESLLFELISGKVCSGTYSSNLSHT